MRRARRTPSTHKCSVDVFRVNDESRTESPSRTWINRAPGAQNDGYVVSGFAKSNPSVQPNGSVAIVGSPVGFNPRNGVARDAFTYTTSDGKGVQTTATAGLIDP